MRVEYLSIEDSAVPLRDGEVGCLFADSGGGFTSDTRLRLSANSTHALLGHGVIDSLNALPLDGHLGSGLQVVIPPPRLESARRLFYLADAKTYDGQYEFAVATGSENDEDVEYRIRIDNREYQNTLSGLQYLLRIASREGIAVWIRI